MTPAESLAGKLVFLFVFLGFLSAFVVVVIRRIQLIRMGRPLNRYDQVGERIKGILAFVLGQKRILDPRHRFPGIMHALIFWGFLVVSINTINFVGSGFSSDFAIIGFSSKYALGRVYFWIRDIFELLVFLAVIVAFYRRLVIKPRRLTLSGGANLILGLIMILMVTDYIMNAIEYRLGEESFASTLVAGFSGIFTLSRQGMVTLHHVSWWIHLVSLMFFLLYLPLSKHFHVLTSFFSVYFRNLEPSALEHMDLEDESLENFGVSQIEQSRWKDILDIYSCTECGRCTWSCPANISGKPLSPKEINIHEREHLDRKESFLLKLLHTPEGEEKPVWEGENLIGDVIQEEALWSCTTCKACEESCPLFIEYIQRIVDMRRSLVLEESRFPSEMQTAFKNLENNGNPWGVGFADRDRWAEGLEVPRMADNPEVEYLFFVGCAGAFDTHGVEVSKAMIRILNAANISYAILGVEETCTGDAARRLGNEYLYQMLAAQNIEAFNNYGVKKIITQCPHCYHTIKNEYPQMGGNYEVIHHTQLIQELLQSGRLKLKGKLDSRLAYHDSCYLGRHNQIYKEPRKALNLISSNGLLELPRHGYDGFCCGAGGGRMWLEEKPDQKVNHIRVKEAFEAGVETLVTACPFCAIMFKDGINDLEYGEKMKSEDLAVLVANLLE